MKFSIIVPVYNVEKYIVNCINSILNQNFDDYEIIIVDDGSTDGSGLICDNFQKKNREIIKVIHQKNGGLSDARNTGIKNAKGEYLMFIDSDDFLYKKDSLSTLSYIIDNYQYDIIQYKMIYFYEKNDKFLELNNLETLDYKENIIECLKILNKKNQISVSACDKIVKASLIKNNNLYFIKGLQSEDIDWSLRLYLYVTSFYSFNESIYAYRQQRKGSITAKATKKNMVDLFNIIKYWYEYDYENIEFRNLYYGYISYQYLILITKSNCEMFNEAEKELIDKMRENILMYDDSKKVKLFNKFKKIFGFKISLLMMKIYLLLKNKGLIKI